MPPNTDSTVMIRGFENLRISPTLDLYLIPSQDLRGTIDTKTTTKHWIIILSSSTSYKCTSLHIHKVREGSRTYYFSGSISRNEPLFSDAVIASGITNLTQFKLCKVSETLYEEIINIAATAMATANNKKLPWTMSFLLALEEARLVPDGTRTYYDRFCEPFWDEIEETMRDLGMDGRRESLVAKVREMGMGL
ncbi:hypothetical protein BDV06DRAFT_221504 [Aspergillus oleicola]